MEKLREFGQWNVPEEVRHSDFGCPNFLWACAECKDGEKYAPKLSVVDKLPSCQAYSYYD